METKTRSAVINVTDSGRTDEFYEIGYSIETENGKHAVQGTTLKAGREAMQLQVNAYVNALTGQHNFCKHTDTGREYYSVVYDVVINYNVDGKQWSVRMEA